MRRAILSVSDKTGLIPFGKALAARGFELVSTGGTAKALADAGLPVINVSDVTGFPEMMDGRVKTLHPKIHGGILARRSHPDDLALARQHGIGLVDLVVVNLYPFVETAAKPGIKFDDLIEQIDIGGPSLVRAASKNFRDVLIVVSPNDYDSVIAELDKPGGPTPAFRFDLARRAFEHTGAYDTAIASTLGEVTGRGRAFFETARSAGPQDPISPQDLTIRAKRSCANCATAKTRINPPRGMRSIRPPASALRRSCKARSCRSPISSISTPPPASSSSSTSRPPSVIKHTNPCGVATGASIADAYVRAREADSLAAFGGIIGLNRTLDEETARAIVSTFIEAVVAPERRRRGAADSRRRKPTCASSWPTSARSPTRASTDRSSARCSCRSAIA